MTTNIYTTPFTLPVGTTTVKYAVVVNNSVTSILSATYIISAGIPVSISESATASDVVTVHQSVYNVTISETAFAEEASWEMPYEKEVIMPVSLCPMPKMQLLKDNGTPAAGYYLYTYISGDPGVFKGTFTDSTASVANTNPVILDAAGRASVWLDGYYYMELWTGDKNVAGSTLVWTQDNVSGDGVSTSAISGTVILTAGTTTTLTNSNLTSTSNVFLFPLSSAAAAISPLYVSARNAGSVVFTHGTSVGTELFSYLIA